MTAAGPPAILFGAVQLWLDRRRAQYFASQSKLLQHVQAPGLGAWLAENPDFLSEPVRQDAAIVFIDISGFTGLSETARAERRSRIAERLLQAGRRGGDGVSGGAITSFMGDGAMVLFGLPQSAADDAFNAAAAASGSAAGPRDWLAALPAATQSRIGFKIGAHFGAIVASRLGGKNQQITTTGDTVNVASRLMEVAAGHGAELAVSDDMLEVAGPRLRAVQGRRADRADRDADPRALRLAAGLAVAGAAGDDTAHSASGITSTDCSAAWPPAILTMPTIGATSE